VPARDPEAFASALEELVSSPELRRVLGAAGRQRLDRLFSASAMVDRTAAIYAGLLHAAPGRLETMTGQAA
jgi:glycosyltransferase involved in cell wall biosynthesis